MPPPPTPHPAAVPWLPAPRGRRPTQPPSRHQERRARRRAQRRGLPPAAWAALMAAAFGTVAVGAWDRADERRARAATAEPATASTIEDGPSDAELPMHITVNVAHTERSGPILQISDSSVAHGGPNGGWLSGGVRLPVRGVGFYTYDPSTQSGPQSPARRWGTSLLVSQVVELGEWWSRTHPHATPLGIGDLSQQHGGFFGGPGVGHASHQNGLDVDIRLPRRDGVEGPANPSNYDRALTQDIIDRAAAQGAQLILVGPSLDVHGPVTVWPNHDDHLHIRWPDPDGGGN